MSIGRRPWVMDALQHVVFSLVSQLSSVTSMIQSASIKINQYQYASTNQSKTKGDWQGHRIYKTGLYIGIEAGRTPLCTMTRARTSETQSLQRPSSAWEPHHQGYQPVWHGRSSAQTQWHQMYNIGFWDKCRLQLRDVAQVWDVNVCLSVQLQCHPRFLSTLNCLQLWRGIGFSERWRNLLGRTGGAFYINQHQSYHISINQH